MSSRPPRPSFGRDRVAAKASSILVVKDKKRNTVTVVQHIDESNSFYRPLNVVYGDEVHIISPASPALPSSQPDHARPPLLSLSVATQQVSNGGKASSTNAGAAAAAAYAAEASKEDETDLPSSPVAFASAAGSASPASPLSSGSSSPSFESSASSPETVPDSPLPVARDVFTTPGGKHAHFPFAATTPNQTVMASHRSFAVDLNNIKVMNAAGVEVTSPTSKEAVLFLFSPEPGVGWVKPSHTQHVSRKKRKRPVIPFKLDPATIKAIEEYEKNRKTPSDANSSTNASAPANAAAASVAPAAVGAAAAAAAAGAILGEGDTKKTAEEEALIKGGEMITLAYSRIKVKQKSCKRLKSQKSVMEKTANEELNNFLKQALIDFISKHKENINAEIFSVLLSLAQYAMEWAHVVGHGIAPRGFKAQVRDNLGAVPKWCNTWMMIFEKLATYFVRLHPGAVKIKPTFKMLKDTQIAEEIGYEVTVGKESDRQVILKGKLKTLELPSRANLPSSSDWIQAVFVVKKLLAEERPLNSVTISNDSSSNRSNMGPRSSFA